jgi:hypothetical protein
MLQVQQDETHKVDYPLLQNKKKNHHHKRFMKVTWSDGSNSSSSDDKMHVVKCVSWKLKAIMRYFLRMMNLTSLIMNCMIFFRHYTMNTRSLVPSIAY